MQQRPVTSTFTSSFLTNCWNVITPGHAYGRFRSKLTTQTANSTWREIKSFTPPPRSWIFFMYNLLQFFESSKIYFLLPLSLDSPWINGSSGRVDAPLHVKHQCIIHAWLQAAFPRISFQLTHNLAIVTCPRLPIRDYGNSFNFTPINSHLK